MCRWVNNNAHNYTATIKGVVAKRERFVFGDVRIRESASDGLKLGKVGMTSVDSLKSAKRIQGDTNQLLELVRFIEGHPYCTKPTI